jgi:hypothetical protein
MASVLIFQVIRRRMLTGLLSDRASNDFLAFVFERL